MKFSSDALLDVHSKGDDYYFIESHWTDQEVMRRASLGQYVNHWEHLPISMFQLFLFAYRSALVNRDIPHSSVHKP